jgi:hypothetical protein
MYRLSRVLILALLCMLVAAPAAQAGEKTPFTGAWTTIDTDGSTEYLAISGGTTVQVTYTDLYGSVCANNGAPTNVFSGSLTGTVTGDTLDATWNRARCGPVTFDWLVGSPATFIYDAEDDVILDGSLIWTRR